MAKPTYQFFAQMFAATGVIISLGFVAYELKQSRDLAVAELNLQQTYGAAEFHKTVLDEENYRSGFTKLNFTGEELTLEETEAIYQAEAYSTMMHYNNWMLDQMGLSQEGEWRANAAHIKRRMANPVFFNFWRRAFSASLQSEWKQTLEELWLEVHGELPPE